MRTNMTHSGANFFATALAIVVPMDYETLAAPSGSFRFLYIPTTEGFAEFYRVLVWDSQKEQYRGRSRVAGIKIEHEYESKRKAMRVAKLVHDALKKECGVVRD